MFERILDEKLQRIDIDLILRMCHLVRYFVYLFKKVVISTNIYLYLCKNITLSTTKSIKMSLVLISCESNPI